MKIVHVTSYFSIQSRYQEYYLAREQVKSGHSVSFITSDRFFPFEDYEGTSKAIYGERIIGSGVFVEEGITIHRLPVYLELRTRTFMIGIRKLLARLKPDIVILHGILTPHTISLAFGKKLAPKIVADDHMTYSQVDKSPVGRLIYLMFRMFFSGRLLARLDKIVAISEGCVRTIHEAFGIPLDRISLITLGADPDIFKFDPEKRRLTRDGLGISEDTIVIAFTGKVYKEKKVNLVIEAISSIRTPKKIHFLLVGSIVEPYREEFSESLKNLTCPYTIAPMVQTDELVSYLCSSDILVYTLPSISTLEASACSRAIICSDEIPERYKADNGIGVRFGELDPLRNALKTLIDDEDLRLKMGERGRSLIENEYSWHQIAEAFVK